MANYSCPIHLKERVAHFHLSPEEADTLRTRKKIAVISKPNGDTFQTLLQDKTFRVLAADVRIESFRFLSLVNIDRKIFIEFVDAAKDIFAA